MEQENAVPLLYDVIQSISWFGVLQVLGNTPFSTAKSSRNFFGECLVLSQFVQHGLVSEICNVLCVVKGSWGRRAFVSLFSASRLTRKYSWSVLWLETRHEQARYTFEDAQPPEVSQGAL